MDGAGQRSYFGIQSHSRNMKSTGNFIQSLAQRGRALYALIISDAHAGLKAASTSSLRWCPRQRCRIPFANKNAQYVPRKAPKPEVAADIRAIFNAADRPQAERLLKETVKSIKRVHHSWQVGSKPTFRKD
ncbi:MAG: transposase [Ardenticatenales bacterium]|nr:transposase [Ardenticatenales bacterium]